MSNISKDDCIILNKCIYDLIQASKQYYKKAVKILKKLEFVGGCFYVSKSEKGVVYIAFYIDDNLIVGDIEAIDEAIIAFQGNGLVLKIVERYRAMFLNNKKRAWFCYGVDVHDSVVGKHESLI